MLGTSSLALGITMGQNSLQPWGDRSARATAQGLLDGAVTYQNQFIYGWGATNPEVSPGNFHWSSLDNRVATMLERRNAIPVITLCGAPDWMTSQGTDTSNYLLNDPPTPSHYGDFAELARQIALRYSAPTNPRPVLYYQVWSELRGFWSRSFDNYDYVAYTALYNNVYDALKSVNPAIRVGGPYIPFEGDGAAQDLGVPLTWSTQRPISHREAAFMRYWLANMHGADFISFDRGVNTNDPNAYSDSQLFKLIHWYGAVAAQIRTLPGYSGQPVWLAEANAFADPQLPGVQRAAEAAVIRSALLGGTNVLLKWQDDGAFAISEPWTPALPITGLYTSTLAAGGGQPYPAYASFKLFHDDFPPGTAIYAATSSSRSVEAVASKTRSLLINESSNSVTVIVNGRLAVLSPYQVTDVRYREAAR